MIAGVCSALKWRAKKQNASPTQYSRKTMIRW